MLRKIRNEKGYWLAGPPLVIFVISSLVAGRGIVETAETGKLKKNGQTIWCKMQNKGAAYCDSQYQ